MVLFNGLKNLPTDYKTTFEFKQQQSLGSVSSYVTDSWIEKFYVQNR